MLSVKIVVPASMATVVKIVELDSFENPRWMILRLVWHAVSEDTNQTTDKQAVFHAHLENINLSKAKKNVQIARKDDRQTLLEIMQQSVMHVW